MLWCEESDSLNRTQRGQGGGEGTIFRISIDGLAQVLRFSESQLAAEAIPYSGERYVSLLSFSEPARRCFS